MHAYPRLLLFALSVAAVGILAPQRTLSQQMTAATLAKTCQSKAQAGACTAFVLGYIEGRNQSLRQPTICLKPGTSVAEAAAGFVEHLNKNRLEMNLEAGLVLGNYLLLAHPCKR
jgi:Rap1a immunity proteins